MKVNKTRNHKIVKIIKIKMIKVVNKLKMKIQIQMMEIRMLLKFKSNQVIKIWNLG